MLGHAGVDRRRRPALNSRNRQPAACGRRNLPGSWQTASSKSLHPRWWRCRWIRRARRRMTRAGEALPGELGVAQWLEIARAPADQCSRPLRRRAFSTTHGDQHAAASKIMRRRPCASGAAAGVLHRVLASLADAKRSGRPTGVQPRSGRPRQGDGLHAPKDYGLPLSRWSCPELAQQIIADGICESISPATVRRWLSEDALKPWQYQSSIFISDPDFAAKAQRVLDLYARVWDGEPLGRNDYVISADREDLHPGPLPLPPHPACRQGPPDPGEP